jgi:thioredoxin 1
MSTLTRFAVVSVLGLAVVAVMTLRPRGGNSATSTQATPSQPGLPRLLDLGATQCIPCRMMAPILEELRRDMAGKLTVEFVDVWQNPDVARKYGISSIPTQIFYDASGNELSRHVGFMSREEILARFSEHGIALAVER